jgi:Zn finger protein HypA/HybF involved in hydrogenase expression
MVSRLWFEYEDMKCWCPSCGECIDIFEEDFWENLPSGKSEYCVSCPECGQSFYVAEEYD